MRRSSLLHLVNAEAPEDGLSVLTEPGSITITWEREARPDPAPVLAPVVSLNGETPSDDVRFYEPKRKTIVTVEADSPAGRDILRHSPRCGTCGVYFPSNRSRAIHRNHTGHDKSPLDPADFADV